MKVAVVGAGLAGLAAACDLSDLGHTVTLIEKRPWAGGKTYSFADRKTGDLVDNGQHVFMACTTEYAAFLGRIGTLGRTRRQRRLNVRVFGAGGRMCRLRALPLPAPLHLAPSFAVYGHLALGDRLRAGWLLVRIWRMSEPERLSLHAASFGDWLSAQGQSARAIRDFWDFMLVPTLNCRSAEASAADALFVLREGFLKNSTSSAVGLGAVPLSELHVAPAIAYIEARGGGVVTGLEVRGVEPAKGGGVAVHLSRGAAVSAHGAVLALPPGEAGCLVPGRFRTMAPFAALGDFTTAPIINLHFWFDRPIADWPFAAFVDSELQWVFNRDRLDAPALPRRHHVVVSLSAAGPYMALDRGELEARFLAQLRDAVPGARGAQLIAFNAIKEPHATFVPAPGLLRPGPRTPIPGIVLAGSYTGTGWPATMEGAVRSGVTAARELDVQLKASETPSDESGGV